MPRAFIHRSRTFMITREHIWMPNSYFTFAQDTTRFLREEAYTIYTVPFDPTSLLSNILYIVFKPPLPPQLQLYPDNLSSKTGKPQAFSRDNRKRRKREREKTVWYTIVLFYYGRKLSSSTAIAICGQTRQEVAAQASMQIVKFAWAEGSRRQKSKEPASQPASQPGIV